MSDRLTAAVAALCDPTTVRVDRLATTDGERDAVRAVNAEARADHDERMAVLQARHAAYSRRRDAAGMRRTLAAIIERETAHRAAIEQRRAAEAVVPSLLERLHDAVESTQGGGGASAGVHRSPIGLAAAELLGQIAYIVGWDRQRPLVDCIRAIDAPDADVEDDALMVEAWVETARAIIEPPRTGEARAACPNCGTRHVVVEENGEQVRKSAISINYTEGYAQCLNRSCGTRWDRDHFPLLAAALYQDVDERQALRAATRGR